MTLAEALATTCIHSVAGLTGDRTTLVTSRPFRARHHTISHVGLSGEGHVPMPGEVAMTHNDVLSRMNYPSSPAMSSRSCANRSRRISQAYTLLHVVDPAALAAFAALLEVCGKAGPRVFAPGEGLSRHRLLKWRFRSEPQHAIAANLRHRCDRLPLERTAVSAIAPRCVRPPRPTGTTAAGSPPMRFGAGPWRAVAHIAIQSRFEQRAYLLSVLAQAVIPAFREGETAPWSARRPRRHDSGSVPISDGLQRTSRA